MNKYSYLNCKGLEIQVKMEEEGVIIDVFEDDDCIATTCKTYEEFGLKVTRIKED